MLRIIFKTFDLLYDANSGIFNYHILKTDETFDIE